MRRRPFIITDPDELRALYVRRRWDLRKIADYYGCRHTTVASACARFGIPTRPRNTRKLPEWALWVVRWASEPTVIDIQLGIEYENGATVAQLSRDYGLAHGRVVDALLRTRVDHAGSEARDTPDRTA
jgi:hypothetical protein